MSTAASDRPQGVYSPVLTPFNADRSPSAPRFVEHCRALLEQGAGLAIFGTNSEANSLTVAEKRALLDALLEAGLPAGRMMPGTGACALPDAVELTRHAVQAGCGGVLMLPPFYYKGVSDEGLFRAFAHVIEQVADERLRIYLYHIPPVSGVPVSLALIDRLLGEFPGIVAGVKDSSGDWTNTEAMLRDFQPRGFDVFAGTETVLLETLRAGGAGCITATGNVNAGPIVELYRRWREDDAEDRQRALNETRAVFQSYPMIPAMKAAIAERRGDPAWATVRPPLVELDETQSRQLAQRLAALS
ncbi:dihydrodipicolinate synthase family protein [Achromobacter denitrificans]|uniref:dihydrodipicolinate synthase family protein n=1 Tax=Achromobacter denitrificans TaxID=32002 RepID=UPI0023E8C89F|nr:dihydrodipicolinate synthase family protein [Achromobacter denitrificans]MBV2160716.1 dihydrodipicolinate synthase family protein [Achromobacter denitrificans]MDF3943086.1 dihydrodipicolinate synthase family protein [Achromobacter denitrificans]MDX3880165.1 dihydrodipicolinate synthase family protein [Achromobacter sp.]WFC67274.1 dihydrodipicolinate synthase family protein [Achromobacter denitrificans]